MEDTLKKIIEQYRECDKCRGIRLCVECMANAKIGWTKTSYCDFLREHGKQAMDDIITVMENVL
ncbi:MAG: hypothetical protein IKB60_03330 [Clostridia bacterium]|nr:hypothetical protein [Clostridia bacterium]